MRGFPVNRGTLALVSVGVVLAGALGYVALRSGPLAPVPVTAVTVEALPVAPARFGIGTVEARRSSSVGPTVAGRVKRVAVDVGERVRAGQVLAEIDPVDLDDRIGAQSAALARAEAAAAAAAARIREVEARASYAQAQADRYERLLREGMVSAEAAESWRKDGRTAEAGLAAARADRDAAVQELARIRSEREGLRRQRDHLDLVAPSAGLVTARHVDPGATVVAGQAVVEVIDPASLWVNARFDQLGAGGLRAGLPARVVVRSQGGPGLPGRVERVEPLADAVTEEVLAKVTFDVPPEPPPSLGELAEVTVELPALPAVPVVPNAGVKRVDGRLGVWLIDDGGLRFAPVKTGAADLEGRVQILDGLAGGERVVVYSPRALTSRTRVTVVERLPGTGR